MDKSELAHIPDWVNPDWVVDDIPALFAGWGATMHMGYPLRMIVEPNTKWGQSLENTWCKWNEHGIVEYMFRGDGPHRINPIGVGFLITPLYGEQP